MSIARRRGLPWPLVVGVLGGLLLAVAPLLSDVDRLAVRCAMFSLAAGTGALALVRRRPVVPWPWRWMVLSMSSFAASAALHLLAPSSAAGDVANVLGSGSLVVVGVTFVLAARPTSGTDVLLEGVIASVAGLTVVQSVLSQRDGAKALDKPSTVVVVVVLVSLTLWLRLALVDRSPGLVLIAVASWLALPLNVVILLRQLPPAEPLWADAGVLVTTLMLALALAQPTLAQEPQPRERTRPPGASTRFPVLAAALLICPAILVIDARTGRDDRTITAVLVTLLSLLFVARFRRLLDEREALRAALQHRLWHDPLTGAASRLRLFECLSEELQRPRGPRAGVIYVDLDGFKPINDRHGHAAGDRVLVAVVERFAAVLHARDLLARLAGDEFVVVVRSTTEPEQVAARMQASLAEPLVIASGPVVLSCSAGWTLVTEDDVDVDVVLGRADAGMYAQKRRSAGRRTDLVRA